MSAVSTNNCAPARSLSKRSFASVGVNTHGTATFWCGFIIIEVVKKMVFLSVSKMFMWPMCAPAVPQSVGLERLLFRFLFVFSSLFHHCCCSVITRYDVGYGSVSVLWNAFMIEVVIFQVLCSDQINESHRIKICGEAERTKRRSSSFNFTVRPYRRLCA